MPSQILSNAGKDSCRADDVENIKDQNLNQEDKPGEVFEKERQRNRSQYTNATKNYSNPSVKIMRVRKDCLC